MGNKIVREKASILTEQDILNLCISTGFSKDHILSCYKTFIADCPDGKLSKKQFQDMYRQLYPNSKSDKFCARIFTIFDCNKDNFLDFYEFLRAIKMTMNGDVKEKLKCAFEIYDLKGDGKIDRGEMKKILMHIYDMLGENHGRFGRNSRIADKKVDVIFEKFDLNKDNSLTLDEFIQGCLKDEYLSQMMKTTFLYE